MISLMIFATLFIPFFYFIKLRSKKTLEIISIAGFTKTNPDSTTIETFNEDSLNSIQNIYERVVIKLHYDDKSYKYTCLTKDLKLPIQIQDKKQTFISKAEIICENNTYDVTSIIKTYSGPNDDFFGNPFNMCWIFPEYKENNKQSYLKIYNENKLQRTIDLLTNEEIVDNNSNDLILYDSDMDSFILEDSEKND